MAGLVLLLVSFVVAVSFGAVPVPASTVAGIIANKIVPGMFEPVWTTGREAIVWEIRIPRAILAACVGAGLAAVGAALQAVTRNPLADPHLLGISSGGACGAIMALLHTGLFLGLLTVPLMAFAGALLATVMVLAVTRLTGATSADKLVLAGVAVSFILMSFANMLIFMGDPRATHTVIFWMLGGLGLAQWNHLVFPAGVLALTLPYLLAKAGDLNAMTIGDETAATLGIPVARFRLTIFVVCSLITGVMVAFSGIIGFVGLMVPHIVRRITGGSYLRVLPASVLVGALILIWADLAARSLLSPEDIPVGIVTGFLGGLFFLGLLRTRNTGN
ncbi:FecCD family ABC transporter permease [Roseibium algae]|uniref:Iron ABC transporter permease n=1 Tax=Roseibium algae TaxID=3123038 RepID=A0ABU8TIA9_9HYPH